jgi:hypothetical protein
MASTGIDMGALDEPMDEPAVAEPAVEAAPAEDAQA